MVETLAGGVEEILSELAVVTGELAAARARQDLLVATHGGRDLRGDAAAGVSWRERPLPL